jgi:hypothetical protein
LASHRASADRTAWSPSRRFHCLAEQFGSGRLVEARFLFHPQDADRLQQAQRTQCVRIRGVLGLLERHRDVALRRQVVDLVGLDLLDDAGEAARIRHVPVVEDQAAALFVRILIEVVNPFGIEQRGAPLDAVHRVALVQQEFGKVCAVLAGDAGNQCDFFHSPRTY